MTAQGYTPGSSAEIASRDLRADKPVRYAASDAANKAAEAITILMAAERKRILTVQWMPDETGKGCRFEVIGVHTGNFIAIVNVDEDGRVTLAPEGDLS